MINETATKHVPVPVALSTAGSWFCLSLLLNVKSKSLLLDLTFDLFVSH